VKIFVTEKVQLKQRKPKLQAGIPKEYETGLSEHFPLKLHLQSANPC
jgi:hypothetical protein